MSDLDQLASSSTTSTVAEIFVAEVAAHLNSSSSSSSTCERASYSSVVRRSRQDMRCASFITSVVEQEPEHEKKQDGEVDVAEPAIIADESQVSLEKPKLPFTEAGRLVGDRQYGDWVVNPKKLKQPVIVAADAPVIVVADAPADEVPRDCVVTPADAPSGCILL